MVGLTIRAAAKVNLSLRVRQRDARGMHPLLSLAQSLGHHDIITMSRSAEDTLEVVGADVPTDRSNLVWRAIDALRAAAEVEMPVAVGLTKRIPAAAGLGGGSADAAASLLAYAELVGADAGDLDVVAATVGADVSFCLHGGLRLMSGYGEQLSDPLDAADDYWMVVMVPPMLLETRRVYGTWDEMGEPVGLAVDGPALPPSLRPHAPLINDLYPAAVACEPSLDDWRAELVRHWNRPVLMSGSGPSLFGFFSDESEASEALSLVSSEARSAFAARPVGYGARFDAR